MRKSVKLVTIIYPEEIFSIWSSFVVWSRFCDLSCFFPFVAVGNLHHDCIERRVPESGDDEL